MGSGRYKKILLTATPLQNSLMELFGLSTIIDDYIFGDSRSFRQLYVNDTDLESLKTRLKGFCKRTLLKQEIALLESFIENAKNIKIDSKTKRLNEGIERGFLEAEKIGAKRKVIVFTESRRTQQYLKIFLDANGYNGKVVTYNGTNTDQESKNIYESWLERNKETGRITESKSSDIRMAILEHFRDTADILVATESAAEGINLQFCSLVINYDLPWNPQRIEQRIGRCHRYGQKYDVVVINFLNERNDVDRQVYDLLEYKFNLFSGVFGASDEVLGSLESGVDFEREVLRIYQQCRKPEEIQKTFAELQQRMDVQI